jgi:hypothetical protein
MGQPNLRLVQPAATTSAWPDPGEQDELLRIIAAQAETINEQFGLLHDYQNALDDAQGTGPNQVAAGTGTATGTSLVMTNVTGAIPVGATVNGPGVPAATTIVTQQSGTSGGAGTYTTSQATTANAAALTFTIPAGSVATGNGASSGSSINMTGVTGIITIGAQGSGYGIPAGTTIVSQQTGFTGGSGSYTTDRPTTANGGPVAWTPAPPAPAWPIPQDVNTLNLLVSMQTAVARTQAALIQHYQDVLNTSQTPVPA